MLTSRVHTTVPMASRHRPQNPPEFPPSYAVPTQHEIYGNDGRAGLSFAEHEMLRQRKTPHGRLFEHYDPQTIDHSIHVPAAKHILLSRSPLTYQQDGRDEYSGQRDARRPIWEACGGMDSVLHQSGPVQTQRYFSHHGSYVPTVLPSALRSQLGPTASAAQQSFGPYWPDGTYSPYRPAPIRDSRYASRDLADPNLFDGQRTLRHQGKLPLPHDRDINHLPTLHQFPPNRTRHEQLLYPPRDGYNDHAPHNKYGTTDSTETVTESIGPSRFTLRPDSASDKIAFRDRTFAWAHGVYVELLAEIQRDSRLNRPPPGNSRPLTKPAIFPKPPQRTGSHFRGLSLGGESRRDSQHYVSQGLGRTEHAQQNLRPPVPVTPFTAPPNQQQHTGQINDRRVSDPIPRLVSNQYQPWSPNAAISALETVELMCRQADTQWTDGMLLAGCLAYGLGNYNKALFWYQSILARDPQHVEAMSNLAATLLALERKDEALQHWLAAVKLRPSYFEAVEHLIGLLCSSHRAREAVNIIEYVEACLRVNDNVPASNEVSSDGDSDTQSRSSTLTTVSDSAVFEYGTERRHSAASATSDQQPPGYGSSGFLIPGADNGRLLALIHAKGNMLYALGDNAGAAASFEDAILISTCQRQNGIRGLIQRILQSCVSTTDLTGQRSFLPNNKNPILLSPERAQQTAQRMFSPTGQLPGLEFITGKFPYKAAVATASNSLLSLAKIYQDGMSNSGSTRGKQSNGTREILALYYLSLSLQRSPSTANNVGILLAGVQHTTDIHVGPRSTHNQAAHYAGVAPGSGVALALAYYNYGLNIDPKHAHLYTNLGSLLKDLGQLGAAIKMYEIAVSWDGNFDIALANLANAVKDQGRITDAITYYQRAVNANPDFAEAVCGLATALNSVCNWYGRGGVYADNGTRDRVHVDERGMMYEARKGSGWINRVVEIVDKQLRDSEQWGCRTLTQPEIDRLSKELLVVKEHLPEAPRRKFYKQIQDALRAWSGRKWEGSRIVRIIERAVRYIGWQWYQDRYVKQVECPRTRYARPALPVALSSPSAPTVLPFHTFTTPLSAKQVRQISQCNALRISVSTLRSPWLPTTVYPPPPPPTPCLRVGYVSSDFNNHPLAHLMQSIFGLHNPDRVKAHCYATTSSDGSVHRQQIERESPVFHDASTWSIEDLVNQIVKDQIHILVNLNGYTRGARNEVFAARPAPIHMSFMGFAGTLGAEWCDYVFADAISVPASTLSPWRRNVEIEDRLCADALVEDEEGWIYSENIIFARSSFFCVDHKQSAPDSTKKPAAQQERAAMDVTWREEQDRRWSLRRQLFPTLTENAVILGNFNQLYKIDPATFSMYLRILSRVPNSILWLLRFPEVGEQNLMAFAREWAGSEVASRVIFTDVAPKGDHITRASVVDLFLDTPECNAHTTAADVIWSGTPILTWAKWDYKMCSRMASSIVASALPEGPIGDEARRELLVDCAQEYEQQAIRLASSLRYPITNGSPGAGRGRGRLMDLRRVLWEARWTSRLFDTKRWVNDLETAYWEAWKRWQNGEGGDIWL